MSRAERRFSPRLPCFVPRLGEVLARLAQQPIAALLARPDALGRALRQASTLLGLEAECLEVPAAWLAGDRAHPPAVREALRTLRARAQPDAPASLVAVPSPVTLTRATGTSESDARAILLGFLRSLGEADVLAGVMLDGDDGVAALGGLLGHFGLTPISIRRPGGDAAVPPGTLVARALPLAALATHTAAELVTTEGPVDAAVAPEALRTMCRAFIEKR